MAVKVLHPEQQPPGENYCEKSSCSHFCLPAPKLDANSPKTSCACPDDLKLSKDGVTCINESKHKIKFDFIIPKDKINYNLDIAHYLR